MVISFMVEAHPERQNVESCTGYICIRCNRVSTDRSNWLEFERAEFAEGTTLQNSLCAACSKSLFPKFYK